MSTLLNYYSNLIDIGTTLDQFQTEFKDHLTSNGWQILFEDTNLKIIDCIPPTTQTIGNSLGKEVVRWKFTNNNLQVATYFKKAGTQNLQKVKFQVNVSGASYSLMVHLYDPNNANYVRHTTTLQASDTSYALGAARLQADLSANTDPRFQAYTWTVDGDVVTGVAKNEYIAYKFAGGSYSYLNWVEDPDNEHTLLRSMTEYASNPIDLTTGFIYFMSVHERSVIFATKTTVNFYGPVYAQYANHATILDQTPSGCALIECVIGSSASGSTSNPIMGRTTHTHRIGAYTQHSNFVNASNIGQSDGKTCNIFNGSRTTAAGTFEDYNNYWTYCNNTNDGSLSTVYYDFSQFNTSANTGNDLDDSSPSMGGLPIKLGTTISQVWTNQDIVSNAFKSWQRCDDTESFSGLRYRPYIPLEDVYTFIPEGTNESLNYTRLLSVTTPLSVAIDSSSNITTITLTDASTFVSKGEVVIGSETFSYTGKTGNQLTGVTRAVYGTSMAAHDANTPVYQAQWFVKINSGALLVGLTKPV